MNKIIIPYHLIIPTAIGVILVILILLYRKKLIAKNKLLWITLLVFIAVYTFLIGRAAFKDIYYQWNLSRYDLNKDGIFIGQEVTKNQQDAMQSLINNVGNSFSFATGLIYAVIISIVVYAIGSMQLFKKK